MALWTSASHTARGYHVLCIEAPCSDPSSNDGTCSAGSSIVGEQNTVCWGGLRSDCEVLATPAEPKELLEIEEALVAVRPLHNKNRYDRLKKAKERKNRWKGGFAFFKVKDLQRPPEPVKSATDLSGLILALEGGSFIWPGIKVGFRRNITLTSADAEDLSLELLTKSLKPLVIEVSSFVDGSVCKHIINKALPHVAKSAVSHMDHDVGKPDTNWRSSSTYFMPSDDEVLRLLDKRVSALTVTRRVQQEYAQVLRYQKGERYAAHHDYFDVNLYKQSADIMRLTKKGFFNRLVTVFFYLTNVEEGGHTSFPRAGGGPQPRNFEDCSRGISVAPQEGRIVIFYSLDPAGDMDEYSLHGGCNVEKGTKWSANKWIWNQPMDYIRED